MAHTSINYSILAAKEEAVLCYHYSKRKLLNYSNSDPYPTAVTSYVSPPGMRSRGIFGRLRLRGNIPAPAPAPSKTVRRLRLRAKCTGSGGSGSGSGSGGSGSGSGSDDQVLI